VVWLATAPQAVEADIALDEGLAAMTGAGFVLWVIARVIGTSLLVPVIEELFFRGYVLRRLNTGGTAMMILAFVVSSSLFAILHDRWVLALVAGVIFGLLMLRSGRLTDAIVAHMAANIVIALWAVMMQNWAVI